MSFVYDCLKVAVSRMWRVVFLFCLFYLFILDLLGCASLCFLVLPFLRILLLLCWLLGFPLFWCLLSLSTSAEESGGIRPRKIQKYKERYRKKGVPPERGIENMEIIELSTYRAIEKVRRVIREAGCPFVGRLRLWLFSITGLKS